MSQLHFSLPLRFVSRLRSLSPFTGVALLLTALFVSAPQPAYAWDESGHMTVSRIAWQNMTPKAKRVSVALLEAAAADTDLRALMPQDSRPLDQRERTFFLRASTWPDIVRDPRKPARRTKYHQGNWHYINYFWDYSGPGVTPRERTDMLPESTNAVERITRLQSVLTSRTGNAEEKAVALAWSLHLVGDIHQPLHTSARVTAQEPRGDQGGNLFKLSPSGSTSLHSYWDNILDISIRHERGESVDSYIERASAVVMARHPRSSLNEELEEAEVEKWAQEGFLTSQQKVYPSTLQRGRRPSESYRRMAYDTSTRAIALAGYRLADMLNAVFGPY